MNEELLANEIKPLIDENERLKEELSIAKSSLLLAMKQSGANYFEYDIINNTVWLSEVSQKYFNLPKLIENYPQCLFDGFLHKDDIETYMTNISKLRKGECDQISFETRFINEKGEYIWHRKYYSIIYDENGKRTKAIGTTFNIENEILNRHYFEMEMKRKSSFDEKYTAYVIYNVTEDEIVEYGSKNDSGDVIANGDGFDLIIEYLREEKVDEDKLKEIEELFSKEKVTEFFSGRKRSNIEFAIIRENEYQWFEAYITYLKNPYSEDIYTFINIYDINEKKWNRNFFKVLQ